MGPEIIGAGFRPQLPTVAEIQLPPFLQKTRALSILGNGRGGRTTENWANPVMEGLFWSIYALNGNLLRYNIVLKIKNFDPK